jgi:hypothetical protein
MSQQTIVEILDSKVVVAAPEIKLLQAKIFLF